MLTGRSHDDFDWSEYLSECNAIPAPYELFTNPVSLFIYCYLYIILFFIHQSNIGGQNHIFKIFQKSRYSLKQYVLSYLDVVALGYKFKIYEVSL